jgi:Amt family ammonium transporter
VLAVGIFADGTYGIGWNGVGATSTHGVRGLIYGDAGQLGAQMVHVVIGFLWAWGVTWLIFKVAQNFMKIRVSEEVELEGLDMPEFGVLAYPDFVMHHAPAGHVETGSETFGNGAAQPVDLEQS